MHMEGSAALLTWEGEGEGGCGEAAAAVVVVGGLEEAEPGAGGCATGIIMLFSIAIS